MQTYGLLTVSLAPFILSLQSQQLLQAIKTSYTSKTLYTTILGSLALQLSAG